MSDNAYASDQITEPSDVMVALDRLVGTWTVTGGAEGTVRYEWMPGRFFLLQYVDHTQYGPDDRPGGDRPSPSVREPPSEEIWSRYYDSDGNTLDYAYELSGDILTVWAGDNGSPAHYGASSAPMAKQPPECGSTPAVMATAPP